LHRPFFDASTRDVRSHENLQSLAESFEAGLVMRDDSTMDPPLDRYAEVDRAVWTPTKRQPASVIVADMKKWPNCRTLDVCGWARPFDGTARASKRR